MPQPPQADKAVAKAVELFEDVQSKLLAEQNAILNLPYAEQAKLTSKSARLRDLLANIEQNLTGLRENTEAWLNSELPPIYNLGVQATTKGLIAAGLPATGWANTHIAAVQIIAQDTYDDILRMTQFVADDTKRWIAEITERKIAESIIGGDTAQQASRGLRVAARAQAASDPVFEDIAEIGVRYRNGAVHSLTEYGDMLMRTKSAVAFNSGTINQATLNGIEFFEGFDGSDCGLTEHNDGNKVNGGIFTAQQAADNPISHPRCKRAWGPRPDISSPTGPFLLSTTEAQRASSAAFEADLATRSIQRSQRRQAASRRVSRASSGRPVHAARVPRR